MSSSDEDDDFFPADEDDEQFVILSARRSRERKIASDAAAAIIMTPVPFARNASTTDALKDLPTEHDALSYLMGRCGWQEMASHAAVCRAWRDAARAKLQEWAVLLYQRVTGGTRGFGPGSLSRASAALNTDSGSGLVVVDKDKLQIRSGPGPGTWRIIDTLISSGAEPFSGTSKCSYANELLAARGGAVTLSGWCSLCDGMTTDDGGETVLLGLSVQAPGRETGFEQRSGKRRPRNGQVVRVRLADGALLQASAMPDTSEALLGQPSGLATCAGRLFVADADKNRVHVLDAKTLKPPAELSTTEAVIGENILSRPHGVAISPSQDLYVCDTANHRVCVFTIGGEHVRCFGKDGRLPGEFTAPLDVAASAWRVYVAEGQRVQVLSLIGDPLQVLRLPGLNLVRGLALSAETARHQRLLVSAGQGGVHIVQVGTAALAPP